MLNAGARQQVYGGGVAAIHALVQIPKFLRRTAPGS
jgi:hypothetical protein